MCIRDRVNPWSALAKALGRAINADVLKELGAVKQGLADHIRIDVYKRQQYDYYKNGNSKVKYQHSSTGSACIWWLRSVTAGGTASFCRVSTDGGAATAYAYSSFGFAPGFKAA